MQGQGQEAFRFAFAEKTIEGAGYECGEAHFLIPVVNQRLPLHW